MVFANSLTDFFSGLQLWAAFFVLMDVCFFLQEARSYQLFVFIGEKEIFRLYPIDFAILINVSIVGFPSGDRAL